MIAATDKGRQGECYILGNEAISFKDFCRLVSEEADCKAPKAFLPIPVANLIAKLSEMRARRTGIKPLMTTFSVYNLARNNEFDSSKAKRELGYRTRSYRETIHDEIKWLKASGKIA
jgi:dihydroflavonol-4-reductase